MNAHRLYRLSTVALVALLAACSGSSASIVPDPPTIAAAPSSAQSTPSTTPTLHVATPSPTRSGPLGGGLLIVYQLDDSASTSKAKTESVYTLDLATGAKRKLGSLPTSEDQCCPDGVVWSADRSRAFLFAGRFRGMVELPSGTLTRATRRTASFFVAVSNRGDRLAWVDDVTGTNESIVIGDLQGKQLRRLTLPTGAWQSHLSWSPDDSTLAVAIHLPLKGAQASHIRLASIVGCCSIDRGVQATHLLIVPVDGSPIRELFDDEAKVAQDQAEPFPTPPPGKTGGLPSHAERSFEPGDWSPDGREVLLTTTVCSSTWNMASRHDRPKCTSSLSTVDVETPRDAIVTEQTSGIFAPSWSPDGRRVSFLAGTGQEGTEEGLFVMDRDGGNLRRLTDAVGTAVWSPDGAWIAFQRFMPEEVAENQYRLEVWVMPVDGGDAPRLIAPHATVGW